MRNHIFPDKRLKIWTYQGPKNAQLRVYFQNF